jgi:hypothetical protein
MQRFLPVGKDAEGAARFLLAALPALGAVLTALAVTGDLVGRMARNHPWASFGAFGCGALAVFLGAIAAFALREASNEERRVLYAGLGVLGAGLVFTVYAGVRTWGDRPQPSITVTPKSGSKVTVSVKGIGLRSSDHLLIEVKQLLHGKPGQPLYGASLGPNDAGEIDHTADVPCRLATSTTSRPAPGSATSRRPARREGTQPAACGCTSSVRRSDLSSRSRGRPSCECRAYCFDSRRGTCPSARLAR